MFWLKSVVEVPGVKTVLCSEKMVPFSVWQWSLLGLLISPVLSGSVKDDLQEFSRLWQDGVEDIPCSRILIVSPLSSPSHTIMYANLANGLAERCHTVDMLVSFESKAHRHPNLTQTSSPMFQQLSEDIFLYRVNEMPPYTVWDGSVLCFWIMTQTHEYCEKMLDDEAFKKYLDLPDDYYDLILITPHFVDDCVLAFAHKARRAGKPWGYLYVTMTVPWVSHAFGNPTLATYRPLLIATWSNPMTFLQQVAGQLVASGFTYFRHYWTYPQVRKVLVEKWDATMPDLAELERTSAISFANEDLRLFSYQEPRVADMIDIACIHCHPPKPLPEHLEEWADKATNGFILFALGTAMKSEHFPEEARLMFLEAFRKFPSIQFLWKWDQDTMAGLPPNVKLQRWLPQNDVLGHKTIKGFITHGGMLGTQEATYHGVPVIGLPIAADQHINMARVVTVDKAGQMLNWGDLSVDKIAAAIDTILNDEKIASSVKRRSAMLRDQPQTPLERGIFWTEYVIRHKYDTGLRSPTRDMYWFEMYAVHVWVFSVVLLISLTATWIVCMKIFLKIVSHFFSVRKNSEKSTCSSLPVRKGICGKKDK